LSVANFGHQALLFRLADRRSCYGKPEAYEKQASW
jgi:hypothetical protein